MRAIDCRQEEGTIVVRFKNIEIIALELIQQIGSELMQVVVIAQDTKKLVIDFQGVEVMSSAMLGKLVLLNKKAKAGAIEVKFCNIAPAVYEVLTRFRDGGLGGAAQPV